MSKKPTAISMTVPCQACHKPITITKRTKVGKATCMADPIREEIIIDYCSHCGDQGGAVVEANSHPIARWLFDYGKNSAE